MKKIPLGNGKYAVVDNADYDWLNQWKWYCNNYGYATRCIYISFQKTKRIYMSRLIMGEPKGFEIDHINGNRLDNRRRNLRICSRSENLHNHISPVCGKSKYRGVCWRKNRKRWRAKIGVKNKVYELGTYLNEIDAAKAYDKKAKELFGEFAFQNMLI